MGGANGRTSERTALRLKRLHSNPCLCLSLGKSFNTMSFNFLSSDFIEIVKEVNG